jgi:hypothetical protein
MFSILTVTSIISKNGNPLNPPEGDKNVQGDVCSHRKMHYVHFPGYAAGADRAGRVDPDQNRIIETGGFDSPQTSRCEKSYSFLKEANYAPGNIQTTYCIGLNWLQPL